MKEVVFIQDWKNKGILYKKGSKAFLSEKKSAALSVAGIIKFVTIKKSKIDHGSNNS
jgi:hypothetical protein